MTMQQLLLLFVSLFTLFRPLANVGPFASLVGHFPRADQRKLAFAVFVNCLVVMLLFVWVGEALFTILGVNSNSLSVTGGIALMIAGLPMMLGTSKLEKVEGEKEPQHWRSMAVIPMTFPMSIGGTTAAYVVSASGFAKNMLDLVAMSVVVVLFCVVIWLTHLFSPPLAARLNPDARAILNRIGGIVQLGGGRAIHPERLGSSGDRVYIVLAMWQTGARHPYNRWRDASQSQTT